MSSIKILPPEEARKIAAGEVIDRPSALLREFIDNALDASASTIEVTIEGGGIISSEVSDDGDGMSREDLELCCKTHATSKIRSVSDLEKTFSLGFRGEALAAAAAVSRLEILSSLDGRQAWKLEASSGKNFLIEQGRRNKGTSVRSLGLFDNIPARKRFLKRESSEAASCKYTFNEKALVFPERTFRFFSDGSLSSFLPPHPSFKERFSRILLNEKDGNFLNEITAQGPGFQVLIVFGGPELWRKDRRQQFIFANKRRIQDYSLLQALEYGLRGLFPNGTHPVGAVYLDIDPALADFNIHPAKREARFSDPAAIHHIISSSLENFRRKTYSGLDFKTETAADIYLELNTGQDGKISTGKLAAEALTLKDMYVSSDALVFDGPGNIRIIGRLFELFILIEYKDRLFIIDQHAAHERILYNSFIMGKIAKQELLVAIPFTTESADDDAFLRNQQKKLDDLGIIIKEEDGQWRIEALPSVWRLSDKETIEEILKLKYSGKHLAEHWAIKLSCMGAIKDKDYLDGETALDLAKEALSLPDPHCPHGRPIWHEVHREELLKAVRRT